MKRAIEHPTPVTHEPANLLLAIFAVAFAVAIGMGCRSVPDAGDDLSTCPEEQRVSGVCVVEGDAFVEGGER
jgi:hypothetical protein